jgi:carbonic anhydrase/acetyltransferase-like protein (isoleucine patch superfamily)
VNTEPNLLPYEGVMPILGRDVFIAPGAYVIGRVTIGDESSVWFGSVLRGDVGAIVIGARSNVQDLSMIHMTGGVSTARIGDDVTVGHGVTLHGCDIGDRCLIGMGSIVLDGVKIGDDCVIAAGTLLTPRMVIPPGSQSGTRRHGQGEVTGARRRRALRRKCAKIPRHAGRVGRGV